MRVLGSPTSLHVPGRRGRARLQRLSPETAFTTRALLPDSLLRAFAFSSSEGVGKVARSVEIS